MKKSGKNDNFWGCEMWSRFYKDMLLSKASGGYCLNTDFTDLFFNYGFYGFYGWDLFWDLKGSRIIVVVVFHKADTLPLLRAGLRLKFGQSLTDGIKLGLGHFIDVVLVGKNIL